MTRLRRGRPGRTLAIFGSALASLGVATLLVAILHYQIGVASPNAVYLLAVVVEGILFGTSAAIATAIASFLLYDFFFVHPVFTWMVGDAGEWLNLVLLLGVGIVVGRLAAMQRSRAESALRNAGEARALHAVTSALLVAPQTDESLGRVAAALLEATDMDHVGIGLGPTMTQERIAARAGQPPPAGIPSLRHVLQRADAGTAPAWIALHAGASTGGIAAPYRTHVPYGHGPDVYLVPLEAGRRTLGSIWATRSPGSAPPGETETRLLATAAQQVVQALERDRFAEEATSAEVARRSESLKTALLDSVSHDLRTPLASIRAAAGSLMDDDLTWSPDELHATAGAIDREADRLNRLVTNLLDMSRIEAGALHVEVEACSLDGLVAEALEVRRGLLPEDRRLHVDIPGDLPPVHVDPVLFHQVLANVLDNAARHASTPGGVWIGAEYRPDGDRIWVTVDDDGQGVPDEALSHLFDKFYRVPRRGEGSRHGTGTGLAVVRGLVEAMGGCVAARPSGRGGLSILLGLPAAAASGAATARE